MRNVGFRVNQNGVAHEQPTQKKGDVMAEMSEPRELLVHELKDLLYAEKQLIKTLPKMAREATDPKLRSGFEMHLEETRGQVDNLKAVFQELGERATGEKCPGIDGIKEEHDRFMKEAKPTSDVCDMFLTGAGARAEHYEIAAYTGVITMARAMGETKAAALLQENLEQEQKALDNLTAIAERLAGAVPASAAA
jgi:ferritin-like metal-binding protein YciE